MSLSKAMQISATVLDEKKIIIVGESLSYSNLSDDKKVSIVLPNNHNFTKLLVKCEHIRTYRGGVQIGVFRSYLICRLKLNKRRN